MNFITSMQDRKYIETIRQAEQPVILFGAGNVAKATLRACQKQGISVKCFCDTYWSAKKSEFLSYPLQSVDYITSNDIVIICSLRFLKDLRKKLQPIGCKLVDFYWVFCDTEWNAEETKEYAGSLLDAKEGFFLSRYDNRENIIVRNLNLFITEKCTLRCEGCVALVDYRKASPNSDFEQDKQAIGNLLSNTYALQLSILGGEPLCHPDLDQYISYCDTFQSFARMSLVTNATIMPSEHLLHIMSQCKRLIVNISDYGAPQQKITQLCELLDQYHILYAVYTKESQWIDYGDFSYRGYSESELKSVAKTCFANQCVALKDGKWFLCGRIAHQYSMHAIPKDDCEFVDLLQIDPAQVKPAIQGELDKPYLRGCQYCSGGAYYAENTLEPGIQCTYIKSYPYYEYT